MVTSYWGLDGYLRNNAISRFRKSKSVTKCSFRKYPKLSLDCKMLLKIMVALLEVPQCINCENFVFSKICISLI